jgi:polypeptide N-acetylgalactosaminyltransferase
MLYLDSHCECNEGWLEPLLARIKENPKAFVVPIIDVIDDKTLEYYHGNGNYFQVGGFTWSGHFTWVDIPPSELARRGSPIAPTRSPTMAGGLFAVARDTFWALGSYDPEMDVWGGENLEMSFRIWQCGGVLETIPCSRVGHIFRSFHPYTFPGNKDTHGINTARTVEVWMDDFKRLFYMHRPDLLNSDIGSVTNRLKFKQDLQCKPFSWFLKNIYPEKFILDDPKHVFAYGRLKNPTSNTCLDNLQNDDKDSYDLGEYACHNFMASAQFFSFSKKYELRREDNCAQVSAPFPQRHEKVEMATCHGQGGEQDWAHTKEGKIIHKETKKCLDAGRGQSMDLLYVAPCQNIPSQVWYFDHYLN